MRPLGLYSLLYIFFKSYEWTQQAKVSHYTRLEMLERNKHASLLGPFIIYEENEVFSIWSQFLYNHIML
jgi:hypothetical protein